MPASCHLVTRDHLEACWRVHELERPAGQLRAMHVIFLAQPIVSLPGVLASRDAGNAVDDEEDADRNGHDRNDRGAGPYETIPQVG